MTLPSMESAYARWARPRLVRKLAAAGLDVEYRRGRGDYVYTLGEDGREREVLDLVGGFGANLFGHNHPHLVAAARRVLDEERVQNAQASVRGLAGELAERLAARVHASTGRDYYVTFTSTGTEAVEAALKHATFERRRRLDELAETLVSAEQRVRQSLKSGDATLSEALFEQAASLMPGGPIDSLDELVRRVFRHNASTFDASPCLVALTGAFHGKTTGSLQMTHRKEFRSPFRHLGMQVFFVRDLASAAAAFDSARTAYLALGLDAESRVVLEERSFVHVAACFVEPIQGEGGVREVCRELVLRLRELSDGAGCPLVFDEVQSGMGRTGRFLAAEHLGIRGDYYVLSKSLGGGLVKLGAVLVERDRYVDEFGYLHTSTFADDDYASAVGIGALDLVEENDCALLRRCSETGSYLLSRLEALRARYPNVVSEVRGRGLMVGVELCSQTSSPSPLLRVLGEQELLGYITAGWFLHEHGIRVAPTISAPSTLRLEPSAYVTHADLDRFCVALEELIGILRNADAYRLVRYLVGRAREELSPARRTIPPPPLPQAELGQATRVAFLSHFLRPQDLTDWDTCLRELSSEECERFLRRTRSELDPFVIAEGNVRSPLGSRTHASVIALPFTPSEVMEAMRAGNADWAREVVQSGVELARRIGCSVIGFGGYTSIVTRNCESIVASDIALTSGNSLTAAAAVDAMFRAADRRELGARRLGVLGAAGNLGKVLAEVAADEVEQLVLVGRPGSESRLRSTAEAIYADVWRRNLEVAASAPLGGIAAALAPQVASLTWADHGPAVGARLFELFESLGPEAPIRIATDPSALAQCNLILCASNSPRPVLMPEHVGAHATIVCDVAAPGDVDPQVARARPNALCLQGGIVRLPLQQHFRVDGMNLRIGEVYGCLAETILLGLAGVGENFSYGTLVASDVRRARALARMHGFVIEEREAS